MGKHRGNTSMTDAKSQIYIFGPIASGSTRWQRF